MNTIIKKIVIGSDHAGVEVKTALKSHLEKSGFVVKDVGTYSAERVDYPDIAKNAVDTYQNEGYHLVILICGTGIGMCIAANKCKGIRSALVHDSYTAQMAREHNHANCLALPARVKLAEPHHEIIDAFLATTPSSGRHHDRVEKINSLEKN